MVYGDIFLHRDKNKKLKIFIFGEKAEKSAPSVTLSRLFSKNGFVVECGSLPDNPLECIDKFKKYDFAFVVIYSEPSDWFVRQVALAGLVNTPVFRYWVGSDVFFANQANQETLTKIKELDKLITKNIVVAGHLADELLVVGIKSIYVPIVPCELPSFSEKWSAEIANTVLVYLPINREEFYGADILEKIITNNKDINFIIVANGGERFKKYKNVKNYGWIEDMEDIYNSVGIILRYTKHDGLPRMVIEALSRGKYIIYSWPLSGCFWGGNLDSINYHLKNCTSMSAPNYSGARLVRSVYSSDVFISGMVESVLIKKKSFNMKIFIYSFVYISSFFSKKLIKNFF